MKPISALIVCLALVAAPAHSSGTEENAPEPKSSKLMPDCPDCVASTAKWDPTGDDPNANFDDGKTYPEEAAIQDREADHEAKMSAWLSRAERLVRQGKVIEAGHAENHAQWHGGRID